MARGSGAVPVAVRIIGRAADLGVREQAVAKLQAAREQTTPVQRADIDSELERLGGSREGAASPGQRTSEDSVRHATEGDPVRVGAQCRSRRTWQERVRARLDAEDAAGLGDRLEHHRGETIHVDVLHDPHRGLAETWRDVPVDDGLSPGVRALQLDMDVAIRGPGHD